MLDGVSGNCYICALFKVDFYPPGISRWVRQLLGCIVIATYCAFPIRS